MTAQMLAEAARLETNSMTSLVTEARRMVSGSKNCKEPLKKCIDMENILERVQYVIKY
jgi:hypothetical protein